MLNVHCVLCILKVEMLRMKMEGMSKGMRERMAEYTRRLEAVASGGTAGCQSRKCGGRHSRKASAGSQRSWSGGSTASNGTAPSALDAAPTAAPATPRRRRIVISSSTRYNSN